MGAPLAVAGYTADPLMHTDYYAFGQEMPGRKWSVNGYRYGFNGKENASEVASGSYDFGARLFDARIGRWLSIDPLMKKYPELSPYNFTANNPILFLDFDGKDYGVTVDHKAKTIVVKATLYATKTSASDANASAAHWNAMSGKYQYKVGNGDKAAVYEIKFEIKVDVSDDLEKRNIKFNKDKSGEANKFTTTSGSIKNDEGKELNGITRKGKEIIVKTGKTEQRQTGGHEVGHTLGLGHTETGLMTEGPKRPDNQTEITQNNITRILENSGIGCVDPKSNDPGTNSNANIKPKVNHENASDAPKNFSSGNVEQVKKD